MKKMTSRLARGVSLAYFALAVIAMLVATGHPSKANVVIGIGLGFVYGFMCAMYLQWAHFNEAGTYDAQKK